MALSRQWYGYRRDARDPRDHIFRPPPRFKVPASSTRLIKHLTQVYDQGEIGSCVAHGSIGAANVLAHLRGEKLPLLSRLQLYYDARVLEGSVNEDSGLEIRDAIKVLANQGCGPEELWPYKPGKFRQRPPAAVYDEKVDFEALRYERVAVDNDIIKAAIAEGYPVIIGLTLFESFESDAVAHNGIVPMPNLETEKNVGGHCMYAIGYEKRRYIVPNSWGLDWGDRGFCYIPEQMVGSPSFGGDYWIIREIKNRGAA